MEKGNNTVTVRIHRVGAFTSGFCMVGFGVLLLLHNLLVMVLAGAEVCMEVTREYWNRWKFIW